MQEPWLHPNPRPIYFAMTLPGVGFALGIVIGAGVLLRDWPTWLGLISGILVLVSMIGLLSLRRMLKTPRLSYRAGRLQVCLGPRYQFELPVEVVECFFPGQGPVITSDRGIIEEKPAETANVIVRLAESAEEWKHREVDAAYGHWCDGYIIIRGTWCEKIDAPLISRLNANLIRAHREQKVSSLQSKVTSK